MDNVNYEQDLGAFAMSGIGPHLGLVTEVEQGRGAALTERMERVKLTIKEIAEAISMSPEQVGQVLLDKVPNSRSWGAIERVIEEREAAAGQAPLHQATSAGQIEIEAEGVFGLARIVIRGDAADAEESFARLMDRLRKGEQNP